MPFVMAFPHARLEALIEGHIEMFEFFCCVSRRLIYYNMRSAVDDFLCKFVIKVNEHFLHLMVHYATQADFCYPVKANE